MSNQHDPSSQIAIIVDEIRTASLDHHGCFSGWQWESLRSKILRAGLSPESLPVILLRNLPENDTFGKIILGFGEATLRALTGKKGIDKWLLSPLRLEGGGLLIPTYDFGRCQKQYELNLYVEMALHRAAEFARDGWSPPQENFRINPPLEETFATLDWLANEHKGEIAVDVETGYGQINTVGFAWSPSDSIALNTLPDRCSDESFYLLCLCNCRCSVSSSP